ncbi:Mediator of RNA polymerase II transcription subunit 11, partial [Lamellibrachia satsuma]
GAGQALSELSRDNPRMKQVENHTNTFLKSLEVLEIGLSKHITYLTQVTTGQAHQGSCYGAYKDVQMAYHRAEHVRSRIQELRNDQHLHQQQQ